MAKHIIIVGGGPAGYVAALHASAYGARVTLIEEDALGGTCLNRGCIPTKALVSACSLLEKLKSAAKFGIELQGQVFAQWTDLQASAQRVVQGMVQGVTGLLGQREVEVIKGRAKFVEEGTLHVEGHGNVQGDFILLCTGSRPVRPAAFPFDGKTVATSDDLLQWDSLPSSVAIVGDGVIACEFAFILSTLGVSVTVIGGADRPAPVLDSDISGVLAREMRKKSIRFLGGVAVSQITHEDGHVKVSRGAADAVEADRVLVCVGRLPNTAGLNIEAVGLSPGTRGELWVDPFMRTCADRVYAAGDVTGRVMLAHAASAQARLAVDHMLGHAPTPLDEALIPSAIFTAPEIGCVGLTEEAARAAGREVRCGKFDVRGLGKAQAMGELVGMTKVVADALTGSVLGVHIIGAHASDMIHEAAVAMRHGACVSDLVATVRAHPTLSEGLTEAAEDVFGQATHGPRKRKSTTGGRHAIV
jgi:dihydrolipoamide dehydrogenase